MPRSNAEHGGLRQALRSAEDAKEKAEADAAKAIAEEAEADGAMKDLVSKLRESLAAFEETELVRCSSCTLITEFKIPAISSVTQSGGQFCADHDECKLRRSKWADCADAKKLAGRTAK